MDCNPPGSSVRGIFKARILEQVAISDSRESSQPRDQIHVSCISWIGWWILYHCTKDFRYLISYKKDQIQLCYLQSSSSEHFIRYSSDNTSYVLSMDSAHPSGSMIRTECMPSRFSCVPLFVMPWTVLHQAPLSTAFSKQEYWSRLPFLNPGDHL